MTIQDLGSLGEFLGSIVVLVTVGYLAFQTRQNTMAIGAQLDAARLSAVQQVFIAAVTSTELQEALKEDRVRDETTNETRRRMYWNMMLANFQWQHMQGRRGLLPTGYEAGRAITLAGQFTAFRSFEEHWENAKDGFAPDFVAWVEEQRATPA